jgi:hypothetical protein
MIRYLLSSLINTTTDTIGGYLSREEFLFCELPWDEAIVYCLGDYQDLLV